MKTNEKIVAGAVAVVGLGSLIYALTRTPIIPPLDTKGGAGADIYFTPVGEYAGAGISAFAASSPVLEGQQTTLTVTVTNKSTQAGVAVAATFISKIHVITKEDELVVLAEQTKTDNYAANGSKTYTFTVTAPLGKGGMTLEGVVWVIDPNGVYIASNSAEEPIVSITLLASIPGGYLWYTGLADWQLIHTTQNVPYGSDVSIAFDWLNSSNISIVGHGALKVVYPDSSIVYPTISAGQDQTGIPGTLVRGVTFSNFKVSQSGTYTLTVTLSSQGVVLATYTYTIVVAAAPIIYGATIVIG